MGINTAGHRFHLYFPLLLGKSSLVTFRAAAFSAHVKDMQGKVHAIDQQQDHRDRYADRLHTSRVTDDQGTGCGNEQASYRQHHHGRILPGIARIEVLFAPAPSSKRQRTAQYKQCVADDRTSNRGLDH